MEALPGTTFFAGGAGDDTITGGEGDERIQGDEGDDTLDGGAGKDVLWGRAGEDTLFGGAGDDTITGGEGDDRLYGGAGADTFVFGPGDGNDTINDFTNGTDAIDLSAFSSITGFSDLTITQNGEDTVIDLSDHGGDEIVLKDFTSSDLDATDFDFSM